MDFTLPYATHNEILSGITNPIDMIGFISKQCPKLKFSDEEDQLLKSLVLEHGTKNWNKISSLMKTRNSRQCRDRWRNYINPDLNKNPFSRDEDSKILEKYNIYGPKWNKIAVHLNDRSSNAVKNRFLILQRAEKRLQYFDSIKLSPNLAAPFVSDKPLKGIANDQIDGITKYSISCDIKTFSWDTLDDHIECGNEIWSSFI